MRVEYKLHLKVFTSNARIVSHERLNGALCLILETSGSGLDESACGDIFMECVEYFPSNSKIVGTTYQNNCFRSSYVIIHRR